MDGDFLGKVKALLSDPESLERITAIAKGMSSPQARAGADVRTGAAGSPDCCGFPDSVRAGGAARGCTAAEPRLAADAAGGPQAAVARGEAREDRLFAAGDDHGERAQGPAVTYGPADSGQRRGQRPAFAGPAGKSGPGAPALHQNERRQLSPRESNRTVMYNTKLSGGSADREQLLRIQRELNEKYENEQPQASAAYAQEAAVAVADEPAQEAAACAPAPPCPPPGAPGAPGKSIGGFLSGLLSNISIDDLILIGIGILLLLDGDEGNDAILILILALLFL